MIKVAFIQGKFITKTGANFINDLISSKVKENGITVENFYPDVSLDMSGKFAALKNILTFFSLIQKKEEILKFDLIQGTSFTPLAFLSDDIPVISHFGSTTRGFLEATPVELVETECKKIIDQLVQEGVFPEADYASRHPLNDMADIEEYVALKATAVVVASRGVRDEILSAGVDENKVHLIHNAIEDFWFNNARAEIVSEPHIVFLGRMGNDAFNAKLKGIDRLIHIYQYFSKTKKVTFGVTANSNLVSWLGKNISNNEMFVDIEKESIPAKLGVLKGSILLIPSRYEGFSLSLLEGMSQGLVPIIYPVGVAPEIIRNGENGFLVHSQEEAIERIEMLLKDSELRSLCSEEAEKTARAFSGSIMSDKFVQLYQKLMTKVD